MSEDETTSEVVDREQTAFLEICNEYHDSMGALREFASILAPAATAADQARVDEIRSYAEQLDQVMRDAGWQPPEAHEDEGGTDPEEPSPNEEEGTTMSLSHEQVDQVLELALKLRSGAIRRRHAATGLLNASILVNVTSQFESLLARLIHAYYDLRPGAISGDDKLFSVKDLIEIGSVEEAIQRLIERRVDSLLSGTIGDWQEFLQKRLNISIEELCPDYHQWVESVQRRHIIVHNNGIVDKKYSQQVNFDLVRWPEETPTTGDRLAIPAEYVSHVIDVVEVLGLLLCHAIWSRLAEDEAELRESGRTPLLGLTQLGMEHLEGERWFAAEHLTKYASVDLQLSESARLNAKFNRWQAVKRLGRWEEIEDEVTSFDATAVHPRYEVGKAALLEDFDRFLKWLPIAVAAGLDAEAPFTWPIFRELRERPDYREQVAVALAH